ncbi:hypothetical protein KO465_04260 [Candidatus Micrarchaeota archaeon]|nr:hypothetical protein [Candidatus Micrarchaeota archaeon]
MKCDLVFLFLIITLLFGCTDKFTNQDFETKNQVFLYKADQIAEQNYKNCVPDLSRSYVEQKGKSNMASHTTIDKYNYIFTCDEGKIKITCDYVHKSGTDYDAKFDCYISDTCVNASHCPDELNRN